MSHIVIEFECGILFCGQVRDFLEKETFLGRNIRFREGKGWLSRTFSIMGNAEDMHAIKLALERFAKSIENI